MNESIHLAHPGMLFLLWTLPVLAALFFFGFQRRRRLLAGFASRACLERIAPDSSNARRWIKAVLLLLGVLALVVSMAGPRYGYTWETLRRSGTSLVVALDCSRSMLAQDVQPDRLERAKHEIQDLLAMLKGERVGLVAFAGTAFLQCPLTLDHEALRLFLSVLGPDYLPVGGSDLAKAMTTALNAFDDKEQGKKFILLITDGEATGAKARDAALDAAREAASKGVQVFCVGVGSTEGAPVPKAEGGGFAKDSSGNMVHSRLDEDTLKQIASITNGEYVRSVSGDMDLSGIYSRHIAGGETHQTEERIQRFTDRYQWLAGLAFVLLLAELLLPARKRTLFSLLLLPLLLLPAGQAHATSARSLTHKGIEAYNKEEYAKSLENFLAAQAEEPESGEAAYNAGVAAYKSGDYQQAVSQFQSAAGEHAVASGASTDDKPGNEPPANPEAAPDPDTAAFLGKTLYNQGNASYRLGNLPQAVSCYEQALKHTPDDEDIKKNLEFVRKKLQEQQQQQQDKNQDKNDQDKDDQKGQDKQKSKQDKNQQDGSGGQDQQQNGQQDQNKDKGQDQESPAQKPEDKGQAGQKPEEQQQQQGNQSPEYESSMDKDKLPETPGKPQSAAAQQTGKDQEGDEQQPLAPPSMDNTMLNRLQDKPGRALMPRYEKRDVEKDW